MGLAEPLDFTTLMSLLLYNIASLAEYEQGMIREQLVAALRKASVEYVGRPRAILNRLRLSQLRGGS